MRKIICLTVLLLMPLTAVSGWEFTKTLSLGYVSESNIIHDLDNGWIKKDWAHEESLKLVFSEEKRPGRRWTIGVDLRNHDNGDFSPYDRFFSGIRVSYREKRRLGMHAPWWRLQASFGKENFPNSSVHNQTLADIQLEYGRRLNPRTVVSGGIGYDQTRGDSTNVLDLKGMSADIHGQYSLNSRLAVSLGLQARKGDIAVHYWENYWYDYYPEISMPSWAKWKGREKVMAKVSGAESLKWSLGLIFNSGRNSSFNLGWDLLGTTRESWTYHDNVFRIQFNHNF